MVEITYSIREAVVQAEHPAGGMLNGYCVERLVQTTRLAPELFGFFSNYDDAFNTAQAMCKEDHEKLGWPEGDERIQYPVREGENG